MKKNTTTHLPEAETKQVKPKPSHLQPRAKDSEGTKTFLRQLWSMDTVLHLLNTKDKHKEYTRTQASSCWMITPNLPTYMTILGVMLIGLPHQTMAYSYPYYDCAKPSSLHTYDRSSLCATPVDPLTESPETNWQLLQVSKSVEISGFACEVRKSLFQGYCGVWGHTKLGGPPSVLTSYPVTRAECEQMIATRKYVTEHKPEGHPLTLGHSNHFEENQVGSIWYEGGDVQCQGQNLELDGKVYFDTVIMAAYQVTIDTNRLLAREDKIESTSDERGLPCSARANYCETQSKTYLWEHPRTKCNLALLKPIQARRVGTHHLISTDSQMLLNLTMAYSNLDCGINKGWHTNFKDLIAVPTSEKLPTVPLNAHDVHQDIDWAAALGYLKYELTRDSAALAEQLQEELCQRGTQDTGLIPKKLQGPHYLLTRGDTYLVFTCKPMIGTVKEGSQCFQEVPLTNGLFIDPVSKLAVDHGTPLACSRFYPLIVKTLEAWVELPHLRSRPAPPNGHHGLLTDSGIEDFSPATIYSVPELREFRQLLSYPTFQQSRLAEILLGDCRHQTECSLPTFVGAHDSQGFNLNMLATGVTNQLIPTWWSRLDHRIQASGTYISLIAIVLYLGHFLVWICKRGSQTRVGVKIQHVWAQRVQKPWTDWYTGPVARSKDEAAMEPLDPEGTAPRYTQPPSRVGALFSAKIPSRVSVDSA